MKVLMISATFPYPPTLGGTPVRTFNLLKHLSQSHDVTLVTQRSSEVPDTDVEALRQWVHHLEVFPRPSGDHLQPGLRGKLSRFARFAVTGRPPSVDYIASPNLKAWVDQWVTSGKGEVVTCEHSVNEVFVQPHHRQHLRKVVIDIHSSLYGTLLNQLQTSTAEKPLRDVLSLPLLRRYEGCFARKFTDLVLTTEEDRRFFAPLARQVPLHVVPNGVDLASFPYRTADPGGQELIFVGAMDYIANVDTAKFLAQILLPALQQRYPQARLTLVGAKPTADVQALANLPGVTVTGRVPSVVEYLHRATICVVPMRIGYGIKNKTLEAMAAGVPVVASDRGLEGLAVDHPLRALRANSLEEYVNTISRLFEDAALRASLVQNARRLIEDQFTWQRAGEKYEQILLS